VNRGWSIEVTSRRIAWTAGSLQGLLSGTLSTIVITLGAPRIGRDRGLDWMEIGTVLLGADSVEAEPRWWHIAAGVFVHQAADLSWAIVFFALFRYWTATLTPPVLLTLALPWAAITAAIEYFVILPRLQPLVPMQVPFWTALGVHVTSGLLYPFHPYVRATITRQLVPWSVFSRGFALVLCAGLAVLIVLESFARFEREPSWPFSSAENRIAEHQFLHHMTAHHVVGIQLAGLAATQAADPVLQRLGRLMVANQAGEARIMERWWRSWTKQDIPAMPADELARIPGIPSSAAIAALASERGARFDDTFIPVMVAHHRGAIDMANEVSDVAEDPRVILLADSIRHAQSRQISAMTMSRASRP
jgi:uncharacterized protein (DUF305 family)